MKILAEYKNEMVYIVATRQNGFCDIVRTSFNILKKGYTGTLSTVQAKDLTILDAEYILQGDLHIDVKDIHNMTQEEQDLVNKYNNMTPKELEELVNKSKQKDKATVQKFNKLTKEELEKLLSKQTKKEYITKTVEL